MYTNTIEGLFEAAAKGTLAELQKIVESGKVDINQLYENKHIINDLLAHQIHPQIEQKILYLVNAGAIPLHDNQFNILFIISNLSNIELRNRLITLISEAEGFRGVYSKYHFAAIQGIAPKTTAEAFNTDHFGLYPIHYAIQKGIAHKGWFEDITYDFATPINKGLYEGINLFWFIKFASKITYREIKLDNGVWSPEKSYQLLISAPLNPEHPFFNESVARYLLLGGDYENFTKFTQGLSADQRTNLLKSAPLNPVNEDYGEPVALLLLLENDEDNFAEFTRLTLNLSPNQSHEILRSSPYHPDGNDYNVSVAHRLLYMKRYQDLTRLTQGLSAEQCFELLQSALLRSNHRYHNITLAWRIMDEERYEDFTRMTQNLSAEQCFKILKSAPLNSALKDYNVSVARMLLKHKKYDDFSRMTQNLSAEQYFELLKSVPLNLEHSKHGMTLAWMLLKDKRYEDFTRMTQNLSAEQRYELLKSKNLNSKSKFYLETLAWWLIENKCYAEFERMIDKLNLDQLIELFFIFKHAMQEEAEEIIYLINNLAKDNELLLIKLLEQFELSDLFEKLYKKLDSDSDGYDAVSYLMLEKSNIALRNLMQSPLDKRGEIVEQINDYLKVLLDIYEQIAAHPKYGKKASEFVGMTISEACISWCKDLFVKYFESINNANYSYIKTIAPLFALEGYAHYLRILGCENPNLARQLGVEFADAKSGKSQKANELLKPTVAVVADSVQPPPAPSEDDDSLKSSSLKRKIKNLDDEDEEKRLRTATLAQLQPDSEEEKNENPKIARNDSKIFSETGQVGTLFRSPPIPNPGPASRKRTAGVLQRSPGRSP